MRDPSTSLNLMKRLKSSVSASTLPLRELRWKKLTARELKKKHFFRVTTLASVVLRR